MSEQGSDLLQRTVELVSGVPRQGRGLDDVSVALVAELLAAESRRGTDAPAALDGQGPPA